MASRSIRDNTLAGLFVIGGAALAVWSSFLLGQRTGLGGVNNITIRFPIATGSHGIKPGAVVMLGGQKIGNVKNVAFFPVDATPTSVDVTVDVPRTIKLKSDASFNLERPLLGSLSAINISSPGSTKDDVKDLADGAIVAGMLAPPALLSQSGFSPQDMQSLRNSITQLDQSMARISQIIEKRGPDVDASIVDIRTMIADLRKQMTPWSDSVTASLDNVKTATARAPGLMDEANATIADGRALVKSLQDVVNDNREKINNAITSVESAASKIDQKLIDELNTSLASAKEAVDSIDKTIDKVATFISSESPNLQRTIANLRLMSDNLKLTAIEVRSQPWRALYKPTNKELSTQSLYDATRAYAEASSDLRAASDSLRALLEAGNVRLTDPAAVEEASKLLAQASERYKKSEQRLLDVLIKEEAK
jgi:ABC-type transporter Mla subunit MlaD